MAAILALLAALAYGAADFYGGLATRRLPSSTVVLRTNVVALAGLLVGSAFVAGRWTGRDALIGALAGVAVTAGLVLLYWTLARGTMSLVAPITGVLAAVVPMAAGLASGERPAATALTGVPLALTAVVLLARQPRAGGDLAEATPPVDAVAALGAGLGFGLFFVAIDATSGQAGLWPVAASSATSVVLLAGAAAMLPAARSRPVRHRAGTSRIIVACGLLGAGGQVCFLLATRRGLLSLVAVIASLYPASTLLLARFVLGERLAGLQRVGVVLAAVAVVLLSVE